MKKILLFTLLSFFTLTSANAAHPQCGETELASIMSDMKDDMKAIKKAAKTDDSAQLTTIAQQLLITVQRAVQYVPLSISDTKTLSTEQQQQYDDYKQGIQSLEKAVLALTKASSVDEQKSALGQIGKAAKKGHKAFKMDCDD